MPIEKRRASRGCTHDPWPCCGTEPGSYGRPKEGICKDCQALIEEGKAARQKAAVAKDAGELRVFNWTSVDYGWPRFYKADCQFPHTPDFHEQLGDAFFAVVNAVSQAAPADTPHQSPKYEMVARTYGDGGKERRYLPWPWVVSEKGHHDSWSFGIRVLMNPAVQQALDHLHKQISAALGGVYHEGKQRGASLLHGLVTGELSQADFDDGLLSSAEQAEQRKARRGY